MGKGWWLDQEGVGGGWVHVFGISSSSIRIDLEEVVGANSYSISATS